MPLLQTRPRAYDAEHVATAANLTGARVRLNGDRLNAALYRATPRASQRIVRDLALALRVDRSTGWQVSVDERATMGGDTVVLAGVDGDNGACVTIVRADVLAPLAAHG